MFTKINLGFGLCLLVILGVLLGPAKHASAAPVKNEDFTNFDYSILAFENGGKPARVDVQINGTSYAFIDTNTTDNNLNLRFLGSGSFICGPQVSGGGSGITIKGSPIETGSGKAYYSATITLGHSGDTTKKCSDIPEKDIQLVKDVPIKVYYDLNSAGAPSATPAPPGALNGQHCTLSQAAPSGYTCDCPTPSNPLDCTLTDGTTAPTSTTKQDCWSGGILGLEWIMCSVLHGIDQGVSALDSVIKCELEFNTTASSSCSSTQYLNDSKQGVQKAWASFRVLATALIVIIMLVAIFSQAINWGPLDAYTLRKAIPKLVAAVILIQLSWFLVKFAIDFTNDLGHGIQALMYAPFGGDANMNLPGLLSGAQSTTPGLDTNAASFNLFETLSLVAAGVGLAFLTGAGALALALPVLMALLIGFFVLVARKVLIILCVILVPIALVAWILPGTKRYFDLWWKTFSRMLMMFPLIIALISAGRIFAFISSGSPGQHAVVPNLAQFQFFGHHFALPLTQLAAFGLVNYILVLVGYFGPYAALPKTLQWSGAALGAVGGALGNLGRRASQPSSKYLGEKAAFSRQQRGAERAARIADDRSRFGKWDKLVAGKYNPFLTRSARRRQFAATRAQGRKTADEAAAEAVIGSKYESANHEDKLTALVAAAQGHVDQKTGLDGREAAVQRFALDKLAEFGDWDKISDLRSGGHMDQQVWEQFVARNIGKIHEKAPHLSPLKPDLSDLSAEEIPNFHEIAMRELEQQVVHGKVRKPDTGELVDAPDPAVQRRRAIDLADRALTNPNISGRLTSEQRDVLVRIRNLAGPELLMPSDPGDPASVSRATNARINYGRQLGSGTLARPDQDVFEQHIVDLRDQGDASVEAREAYNHVVQAAHAELATRVQRAEHEAVAKGQLPDEVAAARKVAEDAAAIDRQRLVAKGLVPKTW